MKRNLLYALLGVLLGVGLFFFALWLGDCLAHADPYCPGCASPTPGDQQPNQLYPPFGGPPVQWQGPSGQGGCFNYGNTGVHCS
ncbi:MAG TPA: hypothetical protein VH164_03050 [Ktedonobacteraceae bacterium]|jgi:hypothetical protein|nr:hypothetical protein [Ktedonobacteraceae bacterium]